MAVNLRLWTHKPIAWELLESAVANNADLAARWAAGDPKDRRRVIAYIALPWGTKARDRRLAEIVDRIAFSENSSTWPVPYEDLGGARAG